LATTALAVIGQGFKRHLCEDQEERNSVKQDFKSVFSYTAPYIFWIFF